jgi:hypothetical protein
MEIDKDINGVNRYREKDKTVMNTSTLLCYYIVACMFQSK